jgi:hypothetical protein
MHTQWTTSRMVGALAMALATVIALSVAPVARADSEGRYQQQNLVSDGFVAAAHTDSNLVNPWGIAFNPFGPVWIADNGSGLSTLYNGAGVPQSLVVTIPPAAGAAGGNPTGIVFNGSNGFVVPKATNSGPAKVSGPAKFIFATEDGVIAGWNPTVDATNAILVVIFQIAITRVTKKYPALRVLALGSLLYAVGVTSLAWGRGFWGFWLSMVVFTIGEMILMPTSSTYAANQAPETMRGRYMSIYGLTWGLASGIGPIYGGFLNDNISPVAIWYGAGLVGMISAVVFAYMANRSRKAAAALPEES